MNLHRWIGGAAGAVIVLALAGAVARAAERAQERPVAGARTTTFDFHDIPVRSALQLIAEEGQFNLVVSDSVQGTITLHLHDVTWEQALATVLRLKGLEQRVVGDTRTIDRDR